MNPKKEFVKAIMSVLRLEQNIYTVGALEEIIDRIDIKDYTMFIGFLGERNSDFEKPIQTIAKAVDEFHRKSITPMALALDKKYDSLKDRVRLVVIGLTEEKMTTGEIGKLKERAKKAKETNMEQGYMNEGLPHNDVFQKWAKKQALVLEESKDETLERYEKEFEKCNTKELYKFAKTHNISPFDILNQRVSRNYFFDILLKPSIVQKIEDTAALNASKYAGIENKKVLHLVSMLEIERSVRNDGI